MRHLISLILMLVLSSPAQAKVAGTFGAPEPVTIKAYGGEAMEPFLSRDGRFLFFNTRNDPGVDTPTSTSPSASTTRPSPIAAG